jgi:hypothetical protein
LWDSVIRYDDGQTGMSPPLGSAFSPPPAGLRGGPRRLDPRKHNAGGFIVGVLRHQFTPECFGEDCLVEMIGQLAGADGLRGEAVNPRKGVLNAADDCSLRSQVWDYNVERPQL